MKNFETNSSLKAQYLNQIKGSMIGGAVGDALGYAVEFLHRSEIFKIYGPNGITEYDLKDGLARISDDTQMLLFTANALLVADTNHKRKGADDDPAQIAHLSYLDWLTTQTSSYDKETKIPRNTDQGGVSWLLDIPELYERRAPGNTCMSSLFARKSGEIHADYIKDPINHSKGCGGVMRIAPLGLHYHAAPEYLPDLDLMGAKLSAITHGHPLGYLPSAVLTHIINRIVYPESHSMTLKEIVFEACDTVCSLFPKDRCVDDLTEIIEQAVALSENSLEDTRNIFTIGEGWVGEEALAIAIYCSLKYQNDFSKGIIASVNHSGDSDSTGAITGNILGALLGYEAIEKKWTEQLELRDIILEMAEDLCYGVPEHEIDEAWAQKYIHMHHKELS